jgi:superfamily II DNA or RNA helicase
VLSTLQNVHDPISPRLATLLRKPFLAQAIAAAAIARKWEKESSAAVIAECGTGKTLISLAAVHVHSDGRPFTEIVMAPAHITLKWAKEALETIPRLPVFLIEWGAGSCQRHYSAWRERGEAPSRADNPRRTTHQPDKPAATERS